MTDAIGIDIGGTTTRVALVRIADGAPQEIDRWSAPTDRDDAIATARAGVEALASRRDLRTVTACGLGVPEYVHAGHVRSELVIRGTAAGVEPAALGLAAETRVLVESDVRCGAVAEWHALADPSASILYISLGTGLSSTLVLPGGVPWEGRTGGAISLGEWESPVAGATLEGYASGDGIAARHEAETGRARTTKDIAAAAARGDAVAGRLLAEAGSAVGLAIRRLHAVLDPSAVVVGGGLGSADGPLWEALEAAARAPIPGRESVGLRRAVLGERSGGVGAALLAARVGGA